MRIKDAWEMIKRIYNEFYDDRVLRLSSALAYYAIFSIGPLLFVVIYLASLAFGEKAVTGEVHRQLQDYVGPSAAKTVESMMAARQLGGNTVTTIIGIITLLFGASGVFGELQGSLNTIWEVEARPGNSIVNFLRDRFMSLAMVLGLGFLLLISMVLTTALQAMVYAGQQVLPLPQFLTSLITVAVNFFAVTILFALIFKILPDAQVKWRDAVVGALFTAVLFTIGKYFLGVYLGAEGTSSSYGAAGSVILVLLWIYYSSLILFVGAEFTQVYSCRKGERIQPVEYAAPVTELARAQQGMPHETLLRTAEEISAARARVVTPRRSTWSSLVTGMGIGFLLGLVWKKTASPSV